VTEKIAVDLGNVQKTLFLPLWGRAVESKKPKPLLVDPAAQEIIEKVDFDFSVLTRQMSELSQYAWIMRSLTIDRVARAFLEKYPRGTIVNIGCGLDTTFDRIDNGQCQWFDLDLPDVICLREHFIPETDRRKCLSSSFLDDAWLNEINYPEHVLFIAAGVFYYFDEKEIKTFLVRLADRFPGSELIFDASSNRGVRVANKMVIKSSGLDEKSNLVWGLDNPKTLLTWDPRIRLVKTFAYFRNLKNPLSFKNKLLGLVSDQLKIQYLLYLKFSAR
jgi:O-methyltransferase involved in polyketide biosynthesis